MKSILLLFTLLVTTFAIPISMMDNYNYNKVSIPIKITCHDEFNLYVNNILIGSGNTPMKIYNFETKVIIISVIMINLLLLLLVKEIMDYLLLLVNLIMK